MQPYFFPYLAHFALIAHSDEWVVFDTSQYTPKTWINRNRVLHPAGGPMYVTVPLDHASQSLTINQVKVLDPVAARRSVLGKLAHYRRYAPFYGAVTDLVEEAFAEPGGDSLAQLNVAALRIVCRYLGVGFRWRTWSESGGDIPAPGYPGGWAPAIASALGAGEYLNPSGGRHLFKTEDFERSNVALKLLDMPVLEYETGPFAFEPNLSVLDVLMWVAPEHARAALGAARVTPAAGALVCGP